MLTICIDIVPAVETTIRILIAAGTDDSLSLSTG